MKINLRGGFIISIKYIIKFLIIYGTFSLTNLGDQV